MKTLTFAFDVQVNEDWITQGTQVEVSEDDFQLNKYSNYTPVIIKEYHNLDGEVVKVTPYVEWFSNRTFVELR